jgi:hypothetical protein
LIRDNRELNRDNRNWRIRSRVDPLAAWPKSAKIRGGIGLPSIVRAADFVEPVDGGGRGSEGRSQKQR